MTGPATYDEASTVPWPDVLNRYQALNDRDAMARAIATLQARGEWNEDRSLNPEDYPPLTTSEHLELLALGEVMARHYRHPALVHHAVMAGATWEQIADAAGCDVVRARQAYREWAEGQHRLRSDFPGGTIGLDDDEYVAAIEAAAAADQSGHDVARRAMAELTCPACKQSFQVPDADNMQDALDVIEAHIGAHPGHLRAAAGITEAGGAEDARRLNAIREVLDRFDWEFDDRQLALEAIDRIADGGQP